MQATTPLAHYFAINPLTEILSVREPPGLNKESLGEGKSLLGHPAFMTHKSNGTKRPGHQVKVAKL